MDCIIFLLQKHIEAKETALVINPPNDDELDDAEGFKKNMKMLQ